LNKNLWGRDVLGEPVDNVPAFYWFGFIEDSVDRVEVTPSDYQNYNAMALGNTFVRSNESLVKLGTGKKIEIIAGAGGRLTVNLSYTGALAGEFSFEGRTEVWAKVPGLIKAHRQIINQNRISPTAGIISAPAEAPNIGVAFTRGNPGDRSGTGVPNGNFYRLPFDVASPSLISTIAALPLYYSVLNVPTSVPIAPDIFTFILNHV
jgi:hypothetical protein